MSTKEYVDNLIKNENVIVFSKTYCPHCKATKELLTSLNCKFNFIELDTMDNGKEIQDYLFEVTNQKTVPNTFIKGQHIGGNDNIQKMHKDGKLLPLIKDLCN
eukprot:jgi/Orpsp1_1/1177579/evm.model.c7180000061996.1